MIVGGIYTFPVDAQLILTLKMDQKPTGITLLNNVRYGHYES